MFTTSHCIYTHTETGRGFVAERTGKEVVDTTCNGTFSTIFIFTCNLDATWERRKGPERDGSPLQSASGKP